MAGTFILATHGNISQLAIPAKALLWGLLAAVALVVYTLQPAELMKKYTTIQTLGWGMFVGGGVLMLLRRPWNVHPVMDDQTVLAMAVIILLGTICCVLFLSAGSTAGWSIQCQHACLRGTGGSHGYFCCMAACGISNDGSSGIYLCTFHGIYCIA